MWNSNSVIAWLLARSGLPTDVIRPPAGGRAPGWQAGLVMARRQQPSSQQAGQAAGIFTTPVAARSQPKTGATPRTVGSDLVVSRFGESAT
jgi:hypothetical protein